jgi:hypothetical protein
MASVRIPVYVSDGGIGEPIALGDNVRAVFFHLPDGSVLEVEAFVRNEDNMIQIRTSGRMTGAPMIVPRAGNVVAVGVLRDA